MRKRISKEGLLVRMVRIKHVHPWFCKTPKLRVLKKCNKIIKKMLGRNKKI